MNNKAIETAKKIKELADKGIGGEKQNAKELLDRFLKKNNLSLDDLESEEKKDFYLDDKEFPKEFEWILIQIVACIDHSMTDVIKYRRLKKTPSSQKEIKKILGYKCFVMLECTAAHYAEISTKFHVYKAAYQKELDLFNYAFMLKNDLMPNEGGKGRDISDEEADKIVKMASTINKAVAHKQIEK
jgi:hypothetical protein